MKKFLSSLIFAAFIFTANVLAQPTKTGENGAGIPPRKPVTVTNFFLEIPNEYIKADTKERVGWIDETDEKNNFLSFTIPANKLPNMDELKDVKSWGEVKLFNKAKGGKIVAMTIAMCAEGICMGDVVFLDYDNGRWTNTSEQLMPAIDKDEVFNTLSEAPAAKVKPKKGVEIPLVYDLRSYGETSTFSVLAQCVNGCDGAIVVKQFKWNGKGFEVYETETSP